MHELFALPRHGPGWSRRAPRAASSPWVVASQAAAAAAAAMPTSARTSGAGATAMMGPASLLARGARKPSGAHYGFLGTGGPRRRDPGETPLQRRRSLWRVVGDFRLEGRRMERGWRKSLLEENFRTHGYPWIPYSFTSQACTEF